MTLLSDRQAREFIARMDLEHNGDNLMRKLEGKRPRSRGPVYLRNDKTGEVIQLEPDELNVATLKRIARE